MSTATTPFTGTYTVDPVHSSFGFAVRYQGVSIFKGTLAEVDAKLVDGKLEGTAQVESISIKSPAQFRAHVLSAEFFDAENHPQVKFTSENIELGDDGTAKVDGELTIKGITGPVELSGTITDALTDGYGQERIGLTLETTVDRTQFDLNWNTPLPTGEPALGNDVTLTAELYFTKAQA